MFAVSRTLCQRPITRNRSQRRIMVQNEEDRSRPPLTIRQREKPSKTSEVVTIRDRTRVVDGHHRNLGVFFLSKLISSCLTFALSFRLSFRCSVSFAENSIARCSVNCVIKIHIFSIFFKSLRNNRGHADIDDIAKHLTAIQNESRLGFSLVSFLRQAIALR